MADMIFLCNICKHFADWESGEHSEKLTNLIVEKDRGEAICKPCLREIEQWAANT